MQENNQFDVNFTLELIIQISLKCRIKCQVQDTRQWPFTDIELQLPLCQNFQKIVHNFLMYSRTFWHDQLINHQIPNSYIRIKYYHTNKQTTISCLLFVLFTETLKQKTYRSDQETYQCVVKQKKTQLPNKAKIITNTLKIIKKNHYKNQYFAAEAAAGILYL